MIELVMYARSFIGTPYLWGGDNPMDGGMDCSGFACELLRAAGVLRGVEDLSAQGIYDYIHLTGRVGPVAGGSFAFYGKSVTQITHVAFCINPYLMLEAGGGGRSTVDLRSAAERNAMVRMRPIRSRGDFLCGVRPDYSFVGVGFNV